MKLIYAKNVAEVNEAGTIANPDYYENPKLDAEEVIIYGDYPQIQLDYKALGIPVETHKVVTGEVFNLQVGQDPAVLLKLQTQVEELKTQLGDAIRERDELLGQFQTSQSELISFKNNVPAMQARIAELESGEAILDDVNSSESNDYESWTVEQIKAYLAEKNIGFKASALKPELLKLIPKE